MTVREFLRSTYEVVHMGKTDYQVVRPKVICKDGFEISIQAGSTDYSKPKSNLKNGNYKEVELGYPSMPDESIEKYRGSGNIFLYVPIKVVEALIEKHGGIDRLEKRFEKRGKR